MTSFNILVTSRNEPVIRECLSPTVFEDVSLVKIAVDHDIMAFVTRILESNPKFRKWPDLHQETEDSLTHGAKGMFQWIYCQFDSLRKCLNRSMAKKALRTLPSSLDEIYNQTLAKVALKHVQYSFKTTTVALRIARICTRGAYHGRPSRRYWRNPAFRS